MLSRKNTERDCKADRRRAAVEGVIWARPTAHPFLCRQAAPKRLPNVLPTVKPSLGSGDLVQLLGAGPGMGAGDHMGIIEHNHP